MVQPMIDPEALVAMFETATATQGAQLKKAASEATLAALHGRELTLKNIRGALKTVSDAAGAGAAKNTVAGLDVGSLLDNAVAGMDDALLKAVDANRVALQQLVAQGADLREKHLKKALSDLDKFEDTLFAVVKKSAAGAGAPLAAAWGPVIEKMQAGGTLSGVKASNTAEQMAEQVADRMQGAMRSTRAASLRAAQTLAESYTAMVSGVLIGMSDALQGKAAPRKTAKPK